MLFTLSAQIIDTLIIKTSFFAIEKSAYAVWWASSSLYSYCNPTPKEFTEVEKLKMEVDTLRDEIIYMHHENNPYKKVLVIEN
jgi:hypothetical protein